MIVIVMGVSGSGKSTIGQMLAESLNWEFSDADAFHSPANIEKMSLGIPLDDSDRTLWLQRLQGAIELWLHSGKNVVLACSALKATYRQLLTVDVQHVKLVYLKGSFDLIQQRLQERRNHFMGSKLLQSQFEVLEEPFGAIVVDISQQPQIIVEKIRTALEI